MIPAALETVAAILVAACVVVVLIICPCGQPRLPWKCAHCGRAWWGRRGRHHRR